MNSYGQIYRPLKQFLLIYYQEIEKILKILFSTQYG